jgi:hypothetical protein
MDKNMKRYAYEYWKDNEPQYSLTVRANTRLESIDILLHKFGIDELIYIGIVK